MQQDLYKMEEKVKRVEAESQALEFIVQKLKSSAFHPDIIAIVEELQGCQLEVSATTM